jgi:hypothetical protein
MMTVGASYGASVQFKRKPPVTFTDNGLTLSACGALTGLGNGDVLITVSANGRPDDRLHEPRGQ